MSERVPAARERRADRPPPGRRGALAAPPCDDLLALQRRAGNAAVGVLLARAPDAAKRKQTPAQRLGELLRADDEEGAIAAFAKLTRDEAGEVLADPALRALAVKAFDDDEMARAVSGLAPGVRLVQRLNWLHAEGSSLALVWPLITDRAVPAAQRTEVYDRPYLRGFFVDICDDDQMAAVVDVLGGTLAQKLDWMLAEGTNWKAVRRLIADPKVDPREKLALYASKEIRNRLTDTLNHQQMVEAVGLLGGTLAQKLNWLYVEDTNWRTVRTLLTAPALPAAEKTALYALPWARRLFVEICGDAEMAEAVLILGGTLEQQLTWMIAEGTSAGLVFGVARATPDAGLFPGRLPRDVAVGLRSELSGADYLRAEQMLTRGLLVWASHSDKHEQEQYELRDEKDPTKGWKLKSFSWRAKFDTEYARTELRVQVRIKLTGEPVDRRHIAIWRTGIEAAWNGAFHVTNGRRRLPVVFEPIFNTYDHHTTIELHKPPIVREDSGNWYAGPTANGGATQDTTDGPTAAHEFGHLIGMRDEYNMTAADFRALTGTAPPPGPAPASGYSTTTIMGTAGTGPVDRRHVQPFVDWLNASRLPGEPAYRLVAGP